MWNINRRTAKAAKRTIRNDIVRLAIDDSQVAMYYHFVLLVANEVRQATGQDH